MGYKITDQGTKTGLYDLSSFYLKNHNNKKITIRNMLVLDGDNHKINAYSSTILEQWFYKSATIKLPPGYTSMDIFLVGGGQAGWHIANLGGTNGGSSVHRLSFGGNGGETRTFRNINDVNKSDEIKIEIGTGGGGNDAFVYTTGYDAKSGGRILTKNNYVWNDSIGRNTNIYINNQIKYTAKGGASDIGDWNNPNPISTGSAGAGACTVGYDGYFRMYSYTLDFYTFWSYNPKPKVNGNGYTNGDSAVFQGRSIEQYNLWSGMYFPYSQRRTTALFEESDTGVYFASGGGNTGELHSGLDRPSISWWDGANGTGNGGSVYGSTTYYSTGSHGRGGNGIAIIRFYAGSARPDKKNMKIIKEEIR